VGLPFSERVGDGNGATEEQPPRTDTCGPNDFVVARQSLDESAKPGGDSAKGARIFDN
jgi:hypothetical protein